jgi:hypothetical protein
VQFPAAAEPDEDVEEVADSPPPKKARTKTPGERKTPGQPRVASKDHSLSTLIQFLKEDQQQQRRDAEAERARQRAEVQCAVSPQ